MRRLLAAYLGLLTLLAGLVAAGAVPLFPPSPASCLKKIRPAFGGRDQSEDEATIRRYFALVEEIAGLERDANAGQQLQDAEAPRAGLENEVAEIIEGRITRL